MNRRRDNSLENFYKMQSKNLQDVLKSRRSRKKSETWFKKDTVDFWRHNRIRNALKPIIQHFPKSSWLTVGDGRYGTDANYLLEEGLNVHASDIQDRLLKIGHDRGFIKEYSRQNAEQLTFKDNEFDFVYCKESYHHFPRPFIALYEMLRVSKEGIVLQEPKDNKIFQNCRQAFFHKIIQFLRKGKEHSFEESGNYVYTLSSREIEKLALGLGYRFVAYKTQQDYYKKGVEFEKTNSKSKLFRKVRIMITIFEILQKIGVMNGGIITVIVLKDVPKGTLVNSLKENGYKTVILPKNPYI